MFGTHLFASTRRSELGSFQLENIFLSQDVLLVLWKKDVSGEFVANNSGWNEFKKKVMLACFVDRVLSIFIHASN